MVEEVQEHPGSMVLGERQFDREDIPWKSRFGNRVSSYELSYTMKYFLYAPEVDVMTPMPEEELKKGRRIIIRCCIFNRKCFVRALTGI